MNDLELMLPSMNLTVTLETCIDAFPRRYFDEDNQEYVIYEDMGPKREYLNYKSMGLSFLLEEICLRGLFMYIHGDGYSKFQNECTYLTEAFWENPSRETFEKTLRGHGFEQWDKKNKFSFVMFKNDIYFRYTARPDCSHVTFGHRDVFS